MPDDQLTRRERLRLEALARAQNMPISADSADAAFAMILRRAEEIEKWLLAADANGH